MMSRHASKVMRLCLVLALAAIAATPPDHTAFASGFVRRNGTNFVLDGRTFPVAGVNNHYLTYGTQEEVTRVLDDAVAMNANVLRTFIQPVVGSLDGTSRPTIWNWASTAETSNLGVNGTYMLYWDTAGERMAVNDGADGLKKLDFLLDEARKRDVKLIVGFLDFWPYTGGAQQMRRWYGSDDVYTFFAQDPRTIADYKTWVRHVLTRVNAINGIPYAADPTILAWELMNEPDFHPVSVLKSWVADMSAFVKSIDANHLLATGHANLYDRFSDLAFDGIDFGTWHGYPIHNGITPAGMNDRIGQLCAIGAQFQKPMLLSEFGWARSNPNQAATYSMWLDTIARDDRCAGWLVWRLVSHQRHGGFPQDDHDQFDVRNDGGPLWTTLADAARRQRSKTYELGRETSEKGAAHAR